MVQTKHQKGKQKKQPQKKKHGKQADISELRGQLDALGLKIIQVTADGNCFFRGLADQLEGDQEEHQKYRSMAVNYIQKNREMFEPFIEDEVPFDEYCESMEKDGTWAGHMELQAASLVTHSNICIHQSLFPRWYIRNFDDKTARMIHLSYHDGEHYNSVRSKEDPCDGAARSIIIKVDASLTAKSNQGKSTVPQSREIGTEHLIHSGCIKMVMSGSGCEDARKVEQVLKQVDGDTDAAIEYLIAERGSQDVLAEDIKVDCQTEDAKNENSKPQKSLLDTPTRDRGSEVRKKSVIVLNHPRTIRKYQEIRFALVDPRKSTSLVVVQLLGGPLNLQWRKWTTCARVKRVRNWERKVQLHPLMDHWWILVHSAFDNSFIGFTPVINW